MIKVKAYSLVEVMAVLVVNLIIFSLSLPLIMKPVRDSHFDQFACELTSHLVTARRMAQITGYSVWFTVKRDPEERYRVSQNSRDGKIEILSHFGSGYPSSISNELPARVLLHPVSGNPIERSFSSTHLNGIVFKSKGSSSGTVVFSDGGTRAVCAVFSGQTGRFRLFMWDDDAESWNPFF